MGLRDEVEASNRRFGEVLAAGDRAALAELYEPDAVFASPGAGPVEGNEAIAAMVLAEPGQTVSLEFRSDHCWEVDGRVVDVGRAGAPGDRDQFAYVVLYRRGADGQLRVVVDVPIPLA